MNDKALYELFGAREIMDLPAAVYKTLFADIKERDERDMNREISPLKQAEDAVLVDSSDMTIDEVVNAINSKISIMSVKEISLINTQVKRIYGSRI